MIYLRDMKIELMVMLLGCWAAAAVADDRGEIGVDADRGRKRIVRVVHFEGVDLADKLLDGLFGVGRGKRREVHHREAIPEDIVGDDFVKIGGNYIELPSHSLPVGSIAILC